MQLAATAGLARMLAFLNMDVDVEIRIRRYAHRMSLQA